MISRNNPGHVERVCALNWRRLHLLSVGSRLWISGISEEMLICISNLGAVPCNMFNCC